ncbi:hypothetical protein [Micromonospora sp. NPDC049359]|uniref:hypothetical protein n=1 Tax=Micromonospora sp. NPDC049359 TaxID=3364270 RepID=UPI0037B1E913
MIGHLLAWCFLLLFSAYTAAAIISFVPAVDRRMRQVRIGVATLRSILPFWGLFAQRFGMFDLDLSYRMHSRSAAATSADADEHPWTPLTSNRWRWWSAMWRPSQRADQSAQILAYRLISGGAADGRDMRDDPAYRRVMASVRRSALQTADPTTADRAEFRLVLTRGYWTTSPPRTIFVSAREPVLPAASSRSEIRHDS